MSVELNAVYRHNGLRRLVTIVGFDHVRFIEDISLFAVAIPSDDGVPFTAPADRFEVREPHYRKPMKSLGTKS